MVEFHNAAALEVQQVHGGLDGLVGLAGVVVVPALGVPDLGPHRGADDGDVLFQARVVPQALGDEDAPLLVRLYLGGAGEEVPLDAFALGQGDGGDLLHQLVPLGAGKHKKAAVEALADVKLVAQVLAELRGHGHPALLVHIMLILACQHNCLSFPAGRRRRVTAPGVFAPLLVLRDTLWNDSPRFPT